MTNDERAAFERFNETCEDGEGYDIPKQVMKRLAVIGVVHHASGGVYSMTEFGHWVLDNTTPPKRQPLTPAQYNMAISCAVDIPPNTYEAVTRAIEAAHDIKAQP